MNYGRYDASAWLEVSNRIHEIQHQLIKSQFLPMSYRVEETNDLDKVGIDGNTGVMRVSNMYSFLFMIDGEGTFEKKLDQCLAHARSKMKKEIELIITKHSK